MGSIPPFVTTPPTFNQGGEWVKQERERIQATMTNLTGQARQQILERKMPLVETLQHTGTGIVGGQVRGDYENV